MKPSQINFIAIICTIIVGCCIFAVIDFGEHEMHTEGGIQFTKSQGSQSRHIATIDSAVWSPLQSSRSNTFVNKRENVQRRAQFHAQTPSGNNRSASFVSNAKTKGQLPLQNSASTNYNMRTGHGDYASSAKFNLVSTSVLEPAPFSRDLDESMTRISFPPGWEGGTDTPDQPGEPPLGTPLTLLLFIVIYVTIKQYLNRRKTQKL